MRAGGCSSTWSTSRPRATASRLNPSPVPCWQRARSGSFPDRSGEFVAREQVLVDLAVERVAVQQPRAAKGGLQVLNARSAQVALRGVQVREPVRGRERERGLAADE